MKLILITPENESARETEAIEALFDHGLELLHVRKPTFEADKLQHYLRSISISRYARMVVHDCFEMAISEGVNRIHLNSRSSLPPERPGVKVSRSCHSLKEIQTIDSYEYVFLSPVFDSISKAGYRSGFTKEALREAGKQKLINEKVIALGGIGRENLSQVGSLGFGGVALIGSIWGDFSQTNDISALLKRYTELKRICDQL